MAVKNKIEGGYCLNNPDDLEEVLRDSQIFALLISGMGVVGGSREPAALIAAILVNESLADVLRRIGWHRANLEQLKNSTRQNIG